MLRSSAAAGRVVAMRRGMLVVMPQDLGIQSAALACTATAEGKRSFEAASAAMDWLRDHVVELTAGAARMDADDLRSILRAVAAGERSAAAFCVRWFAAGCRPPRGCV